MADKLVKNEQTGETGYWRTVKGRKIFFPQGKDANEVIKTAFQNDNVDKKQKELGIKPESNSSKVSIKKSNWDSINNQISDMTKKKMPAGTYTLSGKRITEKYGKPGYQVSISRPEMTSVLNNQEIEDILDVVNRYLETEETEIGFWTDGGEPSHFGLNQEKAMYVARLFNQYSIFDWGNSSETVYKEIDNPYYELDKKLTKEDYLEGKRKLEELLK